MLLCDLFWPVLTSDLEIFQGGKLRISLFLAASAYGGIEIRSTERTQSLTGFTAKRLQRDSQGDLFTDFRQQINFIPIKHG